MNKVLCMNHEVTVAINGREYVRPITVIKTGELRSEGKVGNANFWWRKDLGCKLPVVRINGELQDKSVQRMVAAFLTTWAESVRKPRETKFCFNASEARDIAKATAATSYDPNYLSGHPLWLTNSKLPVKCYAKETGEYLYDRRAIIPEHMRELALAYVPNFCSKCEYRATCNEPCEDPDVKSEEQTISA